MIYIIVAVLGLLTSCQALPQFFQAAESIANDDAIDVMISREALQKETDVDIQIRLQNKDQPKLQSVK